MNEELDDHLKNRITELFDHYEDDSAHEGWLLLREKYPEKEKRRPVMWLWWGSVAAVLLVILGIGIWLNNGKPATKNDSLVINKTPKKDNDTLKINHTNTAHVTVTETDQNQIALNNRIKSDHIADDTIHHYIARRTSGQVKLMAGQNSMVRRNKSAVRPSHEHNEAEQPGAILAQSSNPTKDNQIPNQPAIKNTDTVDAAYRSTKPYALAKADSSGKIIKPMVKAPAKSIFAMQQGDEPKNRRTLVDKKVKFGLYAATYFNYAKGSDNEFNVGAGISSEIRIIGNLKLLTGVALSQNSLNYKSTLPEKANSYLIASLEQPDGRNYLAAAVAPAAGGVVTVSQSTNPILRNYQASLISLDIPVNLKYQFGKSDTYVSAGLSSGTYVNETYQFVYNYPALSSASNISTPLPQNTKTQNILNTFDFARTLNVSFGMGYPLGKTNRIIIEPFLKYPLDGLGSQQLKFGAGGVNLKLNLQPAKK